MRFVSALMARLPCVAGFGAGHFDEQAGEARQQ